MRERGREMTKEGKKVIGECFFFAVRSFFIKREENAVQEKPPIQKKKKENPKNLKKRKTQR